MTRLLPLSISEWHEQTDEIPDLDSAMLKGGYPLLHAQPVNPQDWFASYVTTYIERDVRQLINIKDISAFQRFVRLCAARTGQLLNLSSLAGEAGISHTTARSWISVLEASDIIFLLAPYHKNFGKRLVKTPKLYFIDVGLACWLLGIRDKQLLQLHPMRGALFETLVITEFLKSRLNQGQVADIYFWRDNNGLEADLVYEQQGKLQTIEIKSGKTVTGEYIRAGHRSVKFAKDESWPPCLVYGGDESYQRSGLNIVAWHELHRLFSQDK